MAFPFATYQTPNIPVQAGAWYTRPIYASQDQGTYTPPTASADKEAIVLRTGDGALEVLAVSP